MSNPWELYDLLIDDIADTILVTGNVSEGQWTHVATDDNSLGVAYAMSSYTDRTPDMHNDTMTGKTLVEVAQLAKSWDFSLASVGMAAINAFYCNPDRAAANGFHSVSTHESFPDLFRSYNDRVAGKKVAIIGHFPFAPAALSKADELIMLERNIRGGDLPDSACEYELFDADFVFISGSSFVNKTAPRLMELSQNAYSIMLGPSTPLHPVLFDLGVNEVTGLVTFNAVGMATTLRTPGFPEMLRHGKRYSASKSKNPAEAGS